MEDFKTVGIRELKSKLSSFLKEVKNGGTLLITDRNKIVAEIRKPFEAAFQSDTNPLLAEWSEKGDVILPKRKKSPLERSKVKLKEGTSFDLLNAERGEQ